MASKKATRPETALLPAQDDTAAQVLPKVLIAWRRSADFTQRMMAKRLGITPQNLCDIEKGRCAVSVARAAKWASKLNLSVALAVQYALQAMVKEARLPYVVRVSQRDKK